MQHETDIQQIERLVRLERYLRDTAQWSRWRQCYSLDNDKTLINISWYKGNIDEWVQQSEKLAAQGVSTLHSLVPVDVRVKDGRGLAISHCQIVARFRYQDNDFDLVALLRLVSRLERVNGEWKLLSLEGIYLQDSIQSVVPGFVLPHEFDMGGLADLRISYKCLIWNIERKGLKARRDLPGIDRPELVEEVMQRADAWIA